MTGDIVIPSSGVVVHTFCDANSIYTGVVLQTLVCVCVFVGSKFMSIGSRDEEASVDHAICVSQGGITVYLYA